jgi:hypothetical protein
MCHPIIRLQVFMEGRKRAAQVLWKEKDDFVSL